LGTYTTGLSGADAASFELIGTELYFKAGATLDFEAKPFYEVAVAADDPTIGNGPDVVSAIFTFAVTDVNEAPSAVAIVEDHDYIDELTSTDSPVYVAYIELSDDVLGANALTLVGADADFFEIVDFGSRYIFELSLKAGTVLDFEAKSSYSVAVTVDDGAVGTSPDATSATFTFNLGNANDAPIAVALTNATASVSESASTSSRIKVADIAVTDDALGTNALALTGDDAAFFEIAGTELFLKAGVNLDFETKASYAVAVTVDDIDVGSEPDATSATYILQVGNVSPEVRNGTAGADTITGGSDIDRIFGLAGNDTLLGQGGSDLLTGGAGRDTMTGGLLRDVFDFNKITETGKTGSTRDVIKDFTHGVDDIDLRTIDASTKAGGNQNFKFIGTQKFHNVAGELHYLKSGGNTIIEGDINGDGRADFQIQLTGLKTLSAGDFLL
jgi:Ca2+-binding RTX toxin-like protein